MAWATRWHHSRCVQQKLTDWRSWSHQAGSGLHNVMCRWRVAVVGCLRDLAQNLLLTRLDVGGAGVLLAGRPSGGGLDARLHPSVPLVPHRLWRSGQRGRQCPWYSEACWEHLTSSGSATVVLATPLLNGATGRVVWLHGLRDTDRWPHVLVRHGP